MQSKKKKLEDSKGVTGSRKSKKDRRSNGQQKKVKRTNDYLKKHYIETERSSNTHTIEYMPEKDDTIIYIIILQI